MSVKDQLNHCFHQIVLATQQGVLDSSGACMQTLRAAAKTPGIGRSDGVTGELQGKLIAETVKDTHCEERQGPAHISPRLLAHPKGRSKPQNVRPYSVCS